ncbi:MAG: hypothetical protein RJQ09_20830 [Cyclobacteriaceae bacterium]
MTDLILSSDDISWFKLSMRLAAILILSGFLAQAQNRDLMKEPLRSQIKECFNHIYNSDTYEFGQAAEQLKKSLPNHPMNNLLAALSIYWSKYPLNLNGAEIEKLKKLLDESISKCHVLLEEEPDAFDIKYIDMVSHSILALGHSREGQFFKAAGEAKKAYNYFKEGFKLMEEYPEFYFSSGLYSYYREKYPEIYPIYKTIIWVFKSGDKKEGLRLMKLAFDQSEFAKAEAAHYLSHILLRYEMKPIAALPYVRFLANEYPGNLFFLSNYIETNIFLERYNEAEKWLVNLDESEHPYYRTAYAVFQGRVAESKYQYELAETLFNEALAIAEGSINEETDNLKNLALCGLARLSLLNNNSEKAQEYYELALEDVKYEIYQQEPDEFLEVH